VCIAKAQPEHFPQVILIYLAPTVRSDSQCSYPGTWDACSYVAVGTERAMQETFGSTCHGAGRVQSRSAAKKAVRGSDIMAELASRGIAVKVASISGLAEEASSAYKDVTDVVHVAHAAGISTKVVRARPIGVIKG
jgi:tRNA-splicing ligase RtcB